MLKFIVLILLFVGSVWQNVRGQTTANVKYGQPLKVAKPYISPQLRIILAEVDVTLEVDETGKPLSLAAVNGSPALRSAMLGAAIKTVFQPTTISGRAVKTRGVIAYKVLENRDVSATFYLCTENENCDLTKVRKIKERKIGRFAVTVSDSTLNNQAKRMETPKPPREAKQLCGDEVVPVRVFVRSQTGDVLSANVVSGAEVLHQSAERAALSTKFTPTPNSSADDFYSGLLVYNFSFKNNRPKPEIGKPVQIPKPVLTRTDPVPTEGKVLVKVEVLIDEKGNVISARPISGNAGLHPAAAAAARVAKFSETKINCKRVQAKAIISYEFLANREIKTTASALTPIAAARK